MGGGGEKTKGKTGGSDTAATASGSNEEVKIISGPPCAYRVGGKSQLELKKFMGRSKEVLELGDAVEGRRRRKDSPKEDEKNDKKKDDRRRKSMFSGVPGASGKDCNAFLACKNKGQCDPKTRAEVQCLRDEPWPMNLLKAAAETEEAKYVNEFFTKTIPEYNSKRPGCSLDEYLDWVHRSDDPDDERFQPALKFDTAPHKSGGGGLTKCSGLVWYEHRGKFKWQPPRGIFPSMSAIGTSLGRAVVRRKKKAEGKRIRQEIQYQLGSLTAWLANESMIRFQGARFLAEIKGLVNQAKKEVKSTINSGDEKDTLEQINVKITALKTLSGLSAKNMCFFQFHSVHDYAKFKQAVLCKCPYRDPKSRDWYQHLDPKCVNWLQAKYAASANLKDGVGCTLDGEDIMKWGNRRVCRSDCDQDPKCKKEAKKDFQGSYIARGWRCTLLETSGQLGYTCSKGDSTETTICKALAVPNFELTGLNGLYQESPVNSGKFAMKEGEPDKNMETQNSPYRILGMSPLKAFGTTYPPFTVAAQRYIQSDSKKVDDSYEGECTPKDPKDADVCKTLKGKSWCTSLDGWLKPMRDKCTWKGKKFLRKAFELPMVPLPIFKQIVCRGKVCEVKKKFACANAVGGEPKLCTVDPLTALELKHF